MDFVATWIGYVVMLSCGVAVAAGSVIWASMLSNRASKMAVDAYGGWKVFLEFREWYHNERPRVSAMEEQRNETG